ncbi:MULTISPECIES: (2Fe-2S) ferredoxin domain-containing protein [Methylobacterium]|uniref:(2Fe-2S) ferredoxin domain-containing protein n=1 Tax=Methylobacterium TaxID=407 RepID=UPI001FE11DE3|nr:MULTISPECIES: (2Fe-2S) ferredoxin domain-containing protein [Methylobacterium]MDR7036791.1 hypothetical protein [Methylobacterium sp. BE186]
MSDPLPASAPRPRTAKTKLTEIVAVCAKCAKRQSLGKRAVRGLLKAGLKRSHPKRKIRVVETGCLGPCPKRALAVATGASLARGRVVLLDPAATPDEALAAILPEFGPKAALAAGSGAGENPAP